MRSRIAELRRGMAEGEASSGLCCFVLLYGRKVQWLSFVAGAAPLDDLTLTASFAPAASKIMPCDKL